jgi:hypothetical protein
VSAPEPCSELLVPELVEFIHSGIVIFVGGSTAALEPAVTRAFAPRVSADRRALDLFVGRLQSLTLLSNAGAGRMLSATLCHVLDYRGIQIKGMSAGWDDADGDDLAWMDRYWERFETNVQQVGLEPSQVARLRCRDLLRIRLVPTSLFRQTPGPGAGGAVEGGGLWA